MGALSPTHWLIIVGVLVLLFGAKRLPDAARSLGRSARILKAEVKDMNPDTGADAAAGAATAPASAAPPAALLPTPGTVTDPATSNTNPAATTPDAADASVNGRAGR